MSQRAGWRTVKKRLSDGTVKEYSYPKKQFQTALYQPGSVAEVQLAYQSSPEWRGLAPHTQQMYGIYLRKLEAISAAPAAQVTRTHLLDIRDFVALKNGPGAATGFVRAAKALFSWAAERGKIPTSPAARVMALEGGHLKAWTPEQAAIALERLPEHLRRVVVLGMHTGQRRGDLIAMRWSAWDGRAIRLTQTKTKVDLVIKATPELRAELTAWRGDAPDGAVILTQANGAPWKPTTLSHAMSNALQAKGLPKGLNVHGLRKLLAANLAQAGSTANEIAAVTGHKTLAMLQFYTASADQERLGNAAIDRLSKRKSNRAKQTTKTGG